MKFYFLLFVGIVQLSYGQNKGRKADALVDSALKYESAGDYTNAIRVSKQIFSMSPKTDYLSANAIAGLYGKQGDYKEEITWAELSTNINPKFSDGYINLGNAYASENNFDRADECYKKADSLDATSPYPPYSLGVLAEGKNDFVAAIKYYKESVRRDSTFENGYFNLAAAYANTGDLADANIAITKAIQLDPDDKEAKDMHVHIIEDILKNK